ncbi:putative phage associated protein [Neisseria meningitidis]|nr:putative phage associated protein [Neisseria meningitidis]CWT15185.1 putative phage associated protein [Neisseria meningitidis]
MLPHTGLFLLGKVALQMRIRHALKKQYPNASKELYRVGVQSTTGTVRISPNGKIALTELKTFGIVQNGICVSL